MRELTLLKITVETDDSKGIWASGELGYSAMIGALQEYLRDIPENRIKLADWFQMLSDRCRNDKAPFQV